MLQDLVLVTPPSEQLLSLDETKLHLRVDGDDEDDLIGGAIVAAIDHLDGYSGILGRALVTQTWALSLARFPACGHSVQSRITLPLKPLVGVGSVHYTDRDGVDRLLAADQYQVLAGPLSALEPGYQVTWPATRSQTRAVVITFTAGYGPASAVPAPIRAAAKLIVGDIYANRESQFAAGGTFTVLPNRTVDRLLAPFRVPRT